MDNKLLHDIKEVEQLEKDINNILTIQGCVTYHDRRNNEVLKRLFEKTNKVIDRLAQIVIVKGN